MALVVLLVAGTDGESSTAVGLVGALVVLNVARAAESGADIQEVIAAFNNKAPSALGDSRGSGATDCNIV